MFLHILNFKLAFEHFFPPEDSATGGIGFLTEHLVGGASGETEAAMDTRLNGFGHLFAARGKLTDWYRVLHNASSFAEINLSRYQKRELETNSIFALR